MNTVDGNEDPNGIDCETAKRNPLQSAAELQEMTQEQVNDRFAEEGHECESGSVSEDQVDRPSFRNFDEEVPDGVQKEHMGLVDQRWAKDAEEVGE